MIVRPIFAVPMAGPAEHRGPEVPVRRPFDEIVGGSPVLLEAVHRARLLARVDAPLLLTGETGVGKEVFARAIHEGGPWARGPFVALNCGGLPRDLLASELFGYAEGAFTGARRSGKIGKIGRIEAAQGGTLFLDEIADMPRDLQSSLLRVLDGGEVYPVGSTTSRRVQFRLLAACNRDLRREVSDGRFRMDLFYRVSVASLHIAALRERREDIPLLVEHFARAAAARYSVPLRRFAPETLRILAEWSWPGNVRELRSVVEMALLLGEQGVLGPASLPRDFGGFGAAPASGSRDDSGAGGPLPLPLAEREAISAALRAHRGNLSRAARGLQISRSTLYLKIEKHGLQAVLAEVRPLRARGRPRASSGRSAA